MVHSDSDGRKVFCAVSSISLGRNNSFIEEEMLLKQKIRQVCPHSYYILQSDCNSFVCVNLILTITKTKIVTTSHGSITATLES